MREILSVRDLSKKLIEKALLKIAIGTFLLLYSLIIVGVLYHYQESSKKVFRSLKAHITYTLNINDPFELSRGLNSLIKSEYFFDYCLIDIEDNKFIAKGGKTHIPLKKLIDLPETHLMLDERKVFLIQKFEVVNSSRSKRYMLLLFSELPVLPLLGLLIVFVVLYYVISRF